MKNQTTQQTRGLRSMTAGMGDVCMVVAWAAMIPGLMWLGAAAGF